MVFRPPALFALILVGLAGLFLTAPPVHADFSFVHVTDTHITASEAVGSPARNDAARFKEIATLNPRPVFVINTGDVAESGTPEEYAEYRKIRGGSLSNIPTYAAPGNHDVRWNPTGKEGYTVGTGQPLYQSWNKEKVHFILLDSTVLLQHWGHFNADQLAWLRADLQKTGTTTPVIIGFHHWVGREGGKIDNEFDFLNTIMPYNIRLLLMGHGHSDIMWNVNGIPAVMAKGLYQGSYHVVTISRNRLQVFRRTEKNKAPTELVLSEDLPRHSEPGRGAKVNVENGIATIFLSRQPTLGLPDDCRVTYHVDGNSEEVPLEKTDKGWQGAYSLGGVTPGTHEIVITATLPDTLTKFLTRVPLTLRGPEAVSPLWQVSVGGAVQGKITLSGDTLYVPTMGGDLAALRAQNGTLLWRFHTDGAIFSAPFVQNGTVYFGSADHNVYALNAETGKPLWKTPTGGAVFGGASGAKDVICIGSTDKKIYGMDAKTGKIVWTMQGGGMYQSQSATDGVRFFVGGWDNAFRALDAQSGADLWKHTFGKSFYYSPAIGSPAVDNGTVLVSSNDGVLHAMNAADGTILWEVPGPSLGYSGPLLVQNRVYQASLTSAGRVFAFDAQTGKTLWDTPTGAEIYDSSCVLANANGTQTVYIGSVNGTMTALAADTGRMVWQYRLPPGHLLSSPVADAQAVYIGSMNGQVFALPLSRPAPAR